MKTTASTLERQCTELNAKAVLVIRYPALWLSSFLDVVLIERGMRLQMDLEPWQSLPMSIIFDLLGVATGNGLVDAWAGRSGSYKAWTTALFAAFGAANVIFVLSTADPRLLATTGMRVAGALTLPVMGVVGVLSGAVQAWRQVSRDEAAAAREKAKADKAEREAAKLAEGADKAGQTPAWLDESLSTTDRVKAWMLAHPGQSLRQGARDTGISKTTFSDTAKQLAGIGQEMSGEEQE